MTTTTTPIRKAAEIGFGIEIEANIPVTHRADFPVGSYHHGLSVNLENMDGWTTQSDGSVIAGGEFFAAEIVSPVLHGEDGLVQVVMMLDYLASIRAKVNSSCGLHVHVDCHNVDIRRIVTLFKKFEMAFYDLNGELVNRRLESRYCKPSDKWTGDRYASLNLAHANDRHPYIEIRVWQGAMKPETVVAAIYMAVSLVSRASAPETVVTSDVAAKPTQLMSQYIRRFMVGECMIVGDFQPGDIWQEMMKAAGRSSR